MKHLIKNKNVRIKTVKITEDIVQLIVRNAVNHMEDRIQWIDNCPKCGEKSLECYDAPSSALWARVCNNCNYVDKRNYYEDNKSNIYLCTYEEAIEKGLLLKCPLCGKYCNCWQIKKYKVCFECEIHTERR